MVLSVQQFEHKKKMALASGKVAAKLLFLLISAGETPTLKMCTSRTAIDTDLLRRTAGTAKKKEAKQVEVQEVKSTLAAARSLTPHTFGSLVCDFFPTITQPHMTFSIRTTMGKMWT
eukprot:jgi/Mesen1/1264/ME000129S00357